MEFQNMMSNKYRTKSNIHEYSIFFNDQLEELTDNLGLN